MCQVHAMLYAHKNGYGSLEIIIFIFKSIAILTSATLETPLHTMY